MSEEQVTPAGDTPEVTPETPVGDTPETPTPENPETPETPESPETPETPEEPINPDDYEIEQRGGNKPEAPEGDEDDGVDPEDKEKINKVVDKRMSNVEATLQKQQDEIEVNDYVLKNPEMGRYKPVILKYMQHPAYKNIPVQHIASIVSAKDQQKLGAQKERQAQQKVKQTQNGGSSSRTPAPAKFDAKTASFADMEKEIARVKGQVA